MRGIVIVHGIGSPPEGSHLRAHVRQWELMARDRGIETKVCAATLQRSESGPPTAKLEVGGDQVVVVEAGWKDLVPEPTFVAVALWLVTVGPFTAIDLLRSSGRRFREARSQSRWSAAAFVVEVFVLRLHLLAILFPVWFAPLLGLAAISSLLPGNAGRAALGRVRDFLSSVLGDSYLFIDDPVVREAVIERVRADIAALAATCERVTVIGHSQGGHIALTATSRLDDDVRSRIDLQTWGSGYRKLRQLERVMADEPVSSVRAAAPVLGLPVVASMIFWTDGGWTLIAFGVVALGLLIWWLLRIGSDYELTADDVEETAVGAPDSWTDVWATRDLVSDGALPGNAVSSRRVLNRNSIVGDHSTYRSNPHLMLPTLARSAPSMEASLSQAPLPEPVAGSWWAAWRSLAGVALGCGAWALVTDGWIGLIGVGLVAVPLVVWSRLELHWRLRLRRQARSVPGGPFARWLSDSHDASSFPWLVGAFGLAVLLATWIGTEAPAFIALDTTFGITGGFGSGRAALSSIGCVGLAVVVVAARRWRRPQGVHQPGRTST